MAHDNSRNRPGVKVREPTELRPFDEQQRRVKPAPAGKKPQFPNPVFVTEGFWRDFAWTQPNYLEVSRYTGWPATVPSVQNIWTHTVPSGQVYILTSIIYRAMIPTGLWVNDVVLAGDAYLFAMVRFSTSINDVTPWALSHKDPAWNFTSPATVLLNTDVAVPGMPFQYVAKAGQCIKVDANVLVAPGAVTLPRFMGAELRGLIVGQKQYDLYRTRMGG